MILVALLAVLISTASASEETDKPTPMGNYEVVIKAEKVISTVEDPVKAEAKDLWCQSKFNGEYQDIVWARFVRMKDNREYNATIDYNKKKARHQFNDITVFDGDKYRCDMRLDDGELIFGYMYAYLRPVLHVNASFAKHLHQEQQDPTHVKSTEPIKVDEGVTAELTCPVVGYPVPNILWFKDQIPLEEGDRVYFEGTSAFIKEFQEADVGRYRCVASNRFPVVVDGPEQDFELKLDQVLELNTGLGWITPLMVTLIILLLVFIIIYGCQACKRYKSDNYNVARRENNMRQCEEQRGLTKNGA